MRIKENLNTKKRFAYISNFRFNNCQNTNLLFFYKKQKKYQYCDDGSIGIFNLIESISSIV